jgi:tetratricopeptide (TPR) repeat protein
MAKNEQKEKPETLWDVFEEYAKYIGAVSTIIGGVSTIISAVTSFFSQGSRLASYVLLLLGYLLLADFLWRVITRKSPIQQAADIVLPPSVSRRTKPRHRYSKRRRRMAMAGLPTLTLLTIVLIGVSGWQDIQCWYAVVASRGQLKLIDVNVRQAIRRWCPLPIEPAQDDESLVIVSQFESVPGERGINFAKRIVEDIVGADIEGTRIEKLPPNRIIENEKEARALGEITNATLVIWGWVDEISAAPHYEVISKQITQVELERIQSELDSFDIWVDTELPQGMVYLTEFTIGQVYYLADQYEDALPHFDTALRILDELGVLSQEGTSGWGEEHVYFYRGNTQGELGLSSWAMMDYRLAIQRNDQFAEAYNNLGVGYAALGNEKRALENFNQAIWSKGLGVAFYNRGNYYYNQGNFEQAIYNYNEAINRMDAEFAYIAYYNRGWVYAESQNHEAAVEDYTQAIALAPAENADFHLARAKSYFELCEYELAREDLSKVIEKIEVDQETRVEALTNRGVTYTRLGQYPEALQDHLEALSLDPEYALAHYNLAANRALEGDADGAIEALLKAIELNPDLAASAACDSDFDGIRDHEELQKLVPPPEGCPPAPCR